MDEAERTRIRVDLGWMRQSRPGPGWTWGGPGRADQDSGGPGVDEAEKTKIRVDLGG